MTTTTDPKGNPWAGLHDDQVNVLVDLCLDADVHPCDDVRVWQLRELHAFRVVTLNCAARDLGHVLLERFRRFVHRLPRIDR